MTIQEVAQAARALADQLADDVLTARTRDDHIRLTIRANSARILADGVVEELEINRQGAAEP